MHLHRGFRILLCSFGFGHFSHFCFWIFGLGRNIGGEGVSGERSGGPGDSGGLRPYRREDPEGGFRRRVGGARCRLDRRRRRQRAQPRLGARRPVRPPYLLLRLQQCSLQHLRHQVYLPNISLN